MNDTQAQCNNAYSGVYSAAWGGTTYIYYFRSFHDAKPVPPWHKILATPLLLADLRIEAITASPSLSSPSSFSLSSLPSSLTPPLISLALSPARGHGGAVSSQRGPISQFFGQTGFWKRIWWQQVLALYKVSLILSFVVTYGLFCRHLIQDKQGGICTGEAGELPPHWIWPSLPLVCLKTSLPGKEWFPVTADILLNCSSYQSTLSKGSKQIVFNFDSCYTSSARTLQKTNGSVRGFGLWYEDWQDFRCSLVVILIPNCGCCIYIAASTCSTAAGKLGQLPIFS